MRHAQQPLSASVRARRALRRVTRQCCDAPELVQVWSWPGPVGERESHRDVMARCRNVFDALGYSDVTVINGRTTRSAVGGPAAEQRIDDDAQRAEREEYWWSGDVCWSNPRNGSHVVVPELPQQVGLTFVLWGPDTERVSEALRDVLA